MSFSRKTRGRGTGPIPLVLPRRLLAAAITGGAEERGIALAAASEFQSVTGKGVKGSVEGRQVALGNRALLDELGVDPGDLPARASRCGRTARP